ncbi:MAG: choice-of-anchor J domain-containing protein [Gemmatimonadetes bacterium]|nr:choice-of-anchor J domain-containing protein [Gemmatimonadota bacterium]
MNVQLPEPSGEPATAADEAVAAVPAGTLSHLDSVFAAVTGPTVKTVKLTGGVGGFSGTVDGLATGSGYILTVTGYDQNAIHYYARTTGLTVTAGQNTPGTVTLGTLLAVGLTATPAGATQINLAWRDSASNEDGFKVERCTGAGCSTFSEVVSVAANATSFQNTALTSGGTYGYRVRAFTAAANGAYSGTASATTSSATIALSPTSVTFTATQGGANPAAQAVNVTNSGSGTLSGLAVGTITYGTGASGWLSASLSSTTAPSTLTLTATTGSLGAASYTATVPITSSAATNSPQNVSVTFTVSSAPAPDLIATAFSVGSTPSPAAAGDPISVTTTYQNTGNASAGSFRYSYYFSTDGSITTSDARSPFGVISSGLAAGASFSSPARLIDVPASLAPGTYFVAVIVDDQNAITESNETNNVSPTATVTVVPSLMSNGTFTAGSTPWVASGNAIISTSGGAYMFAPGYALLGVNATLDSVDNASGTMYQDVTIPSTASSATLTFWYNITSDEDLGTPFDFLTVRVLNTSNVTLATVGQWSNEDQVANAGYPNYTQKTFSLTPYIGTTVRIHFQMTSDGSFPTVFRIDNVNVTRN